VNKTDPTSNRANRTAKIFLGVFSLATICGFVFAPAASAHGVGGVQPSNYQTVLAPLSPALKGVRLEPVDLGAQLELTNTGEKSVTVLGYEGEPYLRVGPAGAFRNRLSPATYANRTRNAQGAIPSYADASKPPEWIKISSNNWVRWHDHRAHWMGSQEPPKVRAEPGREQVVQNIRIELLRGKETSIALGAVRWVPGSSILPGLVGALILAAIVAGASRTRRADEVVMAALGLAALGETIHVVGAWNATTANFGSKLGASIYGLGGIAIALVALVWVKRRGANAAAPIVLAAGLFLTLGAGLADITVLSKSQIPSIFSPLVARLTVIFALGLGLGLTLAGALSLSRGQKKSKKIAQET
jgi:hypothetical protein